MLTVIVGFERSGKDRTRSPLPENRYSVMPSTDVTFSTCAYAEGKETSRQRSNCNGALNLPTVHQLRHRRRSSTAATVWLFMGTSGFGYYKLPMKCWGLSNQKEFVPKHDIGRWARHLEKW